MPSTPAEDQTAQLSARQAIDNESKQNAIKNRKESDWFSHEFKASLSTPKSPLSSNFPGRSQKSGEWFPDQPDGTSNSDASSVTGLSSTVRNATPESRMIQQRVCVGSQQDWYKHGDNVPDPPLLTSSKPKSRRSTCNETKQKLTGADPNEWYRHDHGSSPSNNSAKSGKKISKESSNTGLWFSHEDTGNGFHDDGGQTPRGKSRVTSLEADEYYKRDKLGSSADWYTHEHDADETSTVSPRGMKGTNDIASKLKGESEDWFHHDANKGYTNPVPTLKVNSPMAKELYAKSQGGEIKQVFRMEENLRTTWSVPTDVIAPEVNEQNNGHSL